MQQYNLGPETIVEPWELPTEVQNIAQFTLDDLVNKRVDLSVLKKYNLTMTANRQFFRRDKMSILNEKTREIYDFRKKIKKDMLKEKQKKVDAKSNHADDMVLEIMETIIKSLDNNQHGCKILMNSLFGAIGNKYLREYFDIRVAEGITLSGQLSILWINRKIDEYFNNILTKIPVTHEIYNVRSGDGQAETILKVLSGINFSFYSDTDSIYIDLSMLIDKLFTPEQQINEREKIINFIDDLFQKKIEPYIDQSYNELAEYVNAHEQRMFMKRECIAEDCVWVGRKKYVMNVADSEGVRYFPNNDLKIVGMESKKVAFSEVCRGWMEEIYLKSVTGSNEKDIQAFISKKKKEFSELDILDISTPKTANGLEKYGDSNNIFVKGAPKHVKAALFHNHFLRTRDIKGIQEIKSGEKILFVELKKNPYGCECIAYQSSYPKEFDFLTKYIDYEANYEKNFVDPINNFLVALGWTHEAKASVFDWF